MADFMMVMKGTSDADWGPYVEKLIETGRFRGGSSFGNGVCVSKSGEDQPCVATGFMRFEADDILEVRSLLAGNPVYESGGKVELVELVET